MRRVSSPTASGAAALAMSSGSAKPSSSRLGSKAPSGAMRGRIEARAAARLDQRSAERRRGALGRHVDRRARQFERPAVAGKARDQLALKQRAGERRQKRRAGGNGEDVGVDRGGLRGGLASR